MAFDPNYKSDFKVPDGRAFLFTNTKKVTEAQPDFKGEMVLTQDYKAGDTIKFAAWLSVAKNGKNYVKLSEESDAWKNNPNYVKQPSARDVRINATYPREVNDIDDDSVPF